MNNVQAIKTVMEADGGRKLTMKELKDLTPEQRQELGDMCREHLGEAE